MREDCGQGTPLAPAAAQPQAPQPLLPDPPHSPCPQYGFCHISVGDLLREQVAKGTPAGKKAKDFMDKGLLVPDEVVVEMVKSRLAQPDVQERGWLLDGYPRSQSQAEAIEKEGIRPDLFLLVDVSLFVAAGGRGSGYGGPAGEGSNSCPARCAAGKAAADAAAVVPDMHQHNPCTHSCPLRSCHCGAACSMRCEGLEGEGHHKQPAAFAASSWRLQLSSGSCTQPQTAGGVHPLRRAPGSA